MGSADRNEAPRIECDVGFHPSLVGRDLRCHPNVYICNMTRRGPVRHGVGRRWARQDAEPSWLSVCKSAEHGVFTTKVAWDDYQRALESQLRRQVAPTTGIE